MFEFMNLEEVLDAVLKKSQTTDCYPNEVLVKPFIG